MAERTASRSMSRAARLATLVVATAVACTSATEAPPTATPRVPAIPTPARDAPPPSSGETSTPTLDVEPGDVDVDIWLSIWDAEVEQVDDGWEIRFRAEIQAIGGPTPAFGVSYMVCRRIERCGPELPHDLGEEIVAELGVSTVETVGPMVEFERRTVGGTHAVSWRGPDPRGKHFLARFDSTESVAESNEDNNTILIILPAP